MLGMAIRLLLRFVERMLFIGRNKELRAGGDPAKVAAIDDAIAEVRADRLDHE
jgi:hypothetical protein